MAAKKRERITTIINTLLLENAAGIHDLAKKMNVSEMTVRRDLNTLVQDNIVKLIHGAAVLNPANRPDERERNYIITQQETLKKEEKKRIGHKAASLLEPDDIIIIDSGSTTDYLARAIPYEMPLTVLCFAFNILVEINRKKGCSLILAGGHFHEDTFVFESPEGSELIRRCRATRAFISASGINAKLGVTCSSRYEIEAKKASISSALSKILISDSSKFGIIRSAYFADLKDFDTIITDSGISDEYKDIITDLGIKLIIV